MSAYWTTKEMAAYIAVPVPTVYQWRHRGLGPRAARVGRHLRWKQSDVDMWVQQQTSKLR